MTGNEAAALKTLKAMKREKKFTDEQEEKIRRMIEAYEEGNISKAYTSSIMKELKDAADLMEAYYIFENIIPDRFLFDRQELVIKHEGEKQVILSEYLVSGGNNGK